MAPTIRQATRHDASQIAEVINELVREPNPVGFSRAWTAEEIAVWMDRQNDDGAFFVVEDRGRVLGFATIDFSSAEPEEATFGAWIRLANRRQGHGTTLAGECLAFAKARGYKRIRARLPEDNEPALSFLSSIGALVPLLNPGATFELPIYQDGDRA